MSRRAAARGLHYEVQLRELEARADELRARSTRDGPNVAAQNVVTAGSLGLLREIAAESSSLGPVLSRLAEHIEAAVFSEEAWTSADLRGEIATIAGLDAADCEGAASAAHPPSATDGVARVPHFLLSRRLSDQLEAAEARNRALEAEAERASAREMEALWELSNAHTRLQATDAEAGEAVDALRGAQREAEAGRRALRVASETRAGREDALRRELESTKATLRDVTQQFSRLQAQQARAEQLRNAYRSLQDRRPQRDGSTREHPVRSRARVFALPPELRNGEKAATRPIPARDMGRRSLLRDLTGGAALAHSSGAAETEADGRPPLEEKTDEKEEDDENKDDSGDGEGDAGKDSGPRPRPLHARAPWELVVPGDAWWGGEARREAIECDSLRAQLYVAIDQCQGEFVGAARSAESLEVLAKARREYLAHALPALRQAEGLLAQSRALQQEQAFSAAVPRLGEQAQDSAAALRDVKQRRSFQPAVGTPPLPGGEATGEAGTGVGSSDAGLGWKATRACAQQLWQELPSHTHRLGAAALEAARQQAPRHRDLVRGPVPVTPEETAQWARDLQHASLWCEEAEGEVEVAAWEQWADARRRTTKRRHAERIAAAHSTPLSRVLQAGREREREASQSAAEDAARELGLMASPDNALALTSRALRQHLGRAQGAAAVAVAASSRREAGPDGQAVVHERDEEGGVRALVALARSRASARMDAGWGDPAALARSPEPGTVVGTGDEAGASTPPDQRAPTDSPLWRGYTALGGGAQLHPRTLSRQELQDALSELFRAKVATDEVAAAVARAMGGTEPATGAAASAAASHEACTRLRGPAAGRLRDLAADTRGTPGEDCVSVSPATERRLATARAAAPWHVRSAAVRQLVGFGDASALDAVAWTQRRRDIIRATRTRAALRGGMREAREAGLRPPEQRRPVGAARFAGAERRGIRRFAGAAKGIRGAQRLAGALMPGARVGSVALERGECEELVALPLHAFLFEHLLSLHWDKALAMRAAFSLLSAVEVWSDATGRARLAHLLLTARTEELLAPYAGLLERAMGATGLAFVASADVESLAEVLLPMEGHAARHAWVEEVQQRCEGGLSFGAVLDAAVELALELADPRLSRHAGNLASAARAEGRRLNVTDPGSALPVVLGSGAAQPGGSDKDAAPDDDFGLNAAAFQRYMRAQNAFVSDDAIAVLWRLSLRASGGQGAAQEVLSARRLAVMAALIECSGLELPTAGYTSQHRAALLRYRPPGVIAMPMMTVAGTGRAASKI